MKCSGLLGRRWNKYLLIENLVLPGRAKARACAPAVSKTRTVFVAAPNRARTRLIPGVHPRTAPVFPGGEKARGCAGQFAHAPSRRRAVCNGRLVTRVAACNCVGCLQAVRPVCFFPARLRRASRAPCLWLRPVSHARGWFRVQAHAELLFSRAGKRPGFCFLRLGKSPHQTFINEKNVGPNVPPRTETLEKAELCSLVFSSVSLISRRFAARRAAKRPAARKRGEISERVQASPFAQKRLKS